MQSLPKSMLVWRKTLESTEPIREEIPVPAAPADGYLVKILAAGVCHSDYALVQMTKPQPNWSFPYTLGHEGCGEVVQVGSNVDHGSSIKLGDLVSILSFPGCGESSCSECGRGHAQLCKRGGVYGLGSDGSLAPYIAINSRAAVKVPAGVTPEVGAVATDAVLTAYHAVMRIGQVKKEETVVIYGLGGLGFNALQLVLWIGARPIVLDKRQEVLDEAVRFGVPKEDVVSIDTSLTEFVTSKSIVVDTCIDFVGVPESFHNCQVAVRPAGKIVLVGLLAPEVPLQSVLCIVKRLSILCLFGGTLEDLEACLDLISKKIITPQVEKGSMDDFPKVLQDLHHGKIKSRMALVPGH